MKVQNKMQLELIAIGCLLLTPSRQHIFTVYDCFGNHTHLLRHEKWFSLHFNAIWIFFFFFFFHLFCNSRKIGLQCCIGFSLTTTQISHNYTYIPSPLSLPLLPQPHPLRSSQSTSWVPCVI